MNILKHPIYKAIYDACQECEKLPASEQQTRTVLAIGAIEKHADTLLDQVEKLLNHCEDYECEVCSKIICPHGDELHFHHDGCPSCVAEEQKAKP